MKALNERLKEAVCLDCYREDGCEENCFHHRRIDRLCEKHKKSMLKCSPCWKCKGTGVDCVGCPGRNVGGVIIVQANQIFKKEVADG